jgi:hypothetical protein
VAVTAHSVAVASLHSAVHSVSTHQATIQMLSTQ